MLKFLRRQGTPRVRTAPPDRRAYAVGDVHGCLDLLDGMLAQIEEDHAARGPAKGYVVFLGDLVDRGPDSRGVLERLRTYAPENLTPVFLMGNHEEFFLRVLDGDTGLVGQWLNFGGSELASSYGLSEWWLPMASSEAIVQALATAVPREHRLFVKEFGDSFRFGDYLMVHAGVRPGVALDAQSPADLRWIREGFLKDQSEHGVLVVHGHTIVEGPEERPNRIGIDTGAYKGGGLTALGIEGEERWYLHQY